MGMTAWQMRDQVWDVRGWPELHSSACEICGSVQVASWANVIACSERVFDRAGKSPQCPHVDHYVAVCRVCNSAGIEGDGRRKLTAEDVRASRSIYEERRSERGIQNKLAAEFGVSQATISRIVNFHTWKHLV